MAHHIAPVKTYLVVFATLMALLLLTVLAAMLNLGHLNFVIALTIAVIKASVVILYFMHVRWSSALTWVFAGAAVLWLGIMLTLTASDYVTRGSSPGTRIIAPAVAPTDQQPLRNQ
jgi:cytochrome c oxidase subunit 4